jgi:uncharacterized protein YjiS (DUF1127 family)
MSPEQTNLTSEPGRDAAGLHLAVATAKEATGDVLAAALPNASIAALRDALSEKETAGPPVGSTRSILSLLSEYWRTFRRRRQRKRSCVSVHELRVRDLKDIGLTPGDIDHIVACRAIEKLRDDTMYLWRS